MIAGNAKVPLGDASFQSTNCTGKKGKVVPYVRELHTSSKEG